MCKGLNGKSVLEKNSIIEDIYPEMVEEFKFFLEIALAGIEFFAWPVISDIILLELKGEFRFKLLVFYIYSRSDRIERLVQWFSLTFQVLLNLVDYLLSRRTHNNKSNFLIIIGFWLEGDGSV